ncbi:MAG: hypothetical protein JWM88_1330 [Verrucomicrobia bacterium]|nr:hypothetical protein [Verrucomicrobiota bacterium]
MLSFADGGGIFTTKVAQRGLDLRVLRDLRGEINSEGPVSRVQSAANRKKKAGNKLPAFA